jgi:hypothetical protein|tara:strand:- start:95 stop:376 length:282 start_codon:yes stop_codon:yes gene_type:complete
MNEENDIILTIQGVVYRQSEMDTPARLRAFNNLIVLESEAVKLDDRRIDTHIRKEGWTNVFISLMNGEEPQQEEEEEAEVDIEETDAFPPEED